MAGSARPTEGIAPSLYCLPTRNTKDYRRSVSLPDVKNSFFSHTSPLKDDIMYHEQQLLANDPAMSKEIRELQEQKRLEQQYHQITSKLSTDQQALLQMHTGIQPADPLSKDYLYNSSAGYGSRYRGGRDNYLRSEYTNSFNRLGSHPYPGSGGLLTNREYTNPLHQPSYLRTGQYNKNLGYDSLYDPNSYYSGSKAGYGGMSDLTGTNLYSGSTSKKLNQYGSHSYGHFDETKKRAGGSTFPMGPPSFLHQGLEGDTTLLGNPRMSPPVKRFLLTKDPKDRRTSGNGLGLKVLGGKEIPGSRGRVCGFVSKIFPSGIVDKLREVHEGDMILEWNGVSLMDRTDSEVKRIIDQSSIQTEVEILIRNDVNMITGKRMPDFSGKLPDLSGFRDQDWYSSGGYEPYFREYPTRSKRYGNYHTDVNGNRYSDGTMGYDYQYGARDPYSQYGSSHNQMGYGFDNQYSSSKNDFRSRKYGDEMNRYGNVNDPLWKESFSDRRRKRDYDRYGDRELPSIPGFGRRHSWDHYDDMYNRDQHMRSKSSYGYRDSDYYNRGSNLRTRHHSDPAFRTDYTRAVRRWHSTDRYPDEYRNRHLPEIKKLSKNYMDDPRERKYGSAQYLDYSSQKYREEFEDARRDLDKFQRYGSFKDYGNHYNRYHNKHRDYDDRYRDDSQYGHFRSKWYERDRYADGSRHRDDDRHRRDHHRDRFDYYGGGSGEQSGRRYHNFSSDSKYRDHRDPYYESKSKSRMSGDRNLDDRYYDSSYRNQNPSVDHYRTGHSSGQFRDERDYSDMRHRDYRYNQSYGGDYDMNESDRRHRSRNPPQQLNLDGRTGYGSPSVGRRDDTKNRDRKGKSTSKDKSRRKRHHNQPARAEVELLICHDMVAQILYVTVLRARHLLTLREDGDTRPDPFIKVYLLPGRSLENQRRTRHFIRTSSPEWNQTMVYPNLQATDLRKHYLEVTAWNYDQQRPNEFLGEVLLDLSDPSVVDEDPKWYQLQEMSDRSDMPGNIKLLNERVRH